MNYTEAQVYLNSFINFERNVPNRAMREAITLDRVRDLAQRLGNPQSRFKSVHVAGTKGKGSTCAFAESIFRAAGLKTGLYVSPHLQDVRERISISGEMISESEFARLLQDCVPVLEEMRNPPEGERRPTYFEVLTHLAFTWFAEQRVDVAVVEVGLGGRLDATNIILPVACAITNISLDHQAILGDTLDQIAAEKAGIMKAAVPVIVAPQTPGVMRRLESCAQKAGTRCETPGRDFEIKVLPREARGPWPLPEAEVSLRDGTVFRAALGLRGQHQVENWAVAVRLADVFWQATRGAHVPANAVTKGSANVCWPGRLEQISVPAPDGAHEKGPDIFLDGAHNEHSMRTVLQELRAGYGNKTPALLFACAKDKNSEEMLRVAFEAGIENVVFTHSGNTRGKDPGELAREWKQLSGRDAAIHPVCADGFEAARRTAGSGGALLITGSLYLVGAIKDVLAGTPLKSSAN